MSLARNAVITAALVAAGLGAQVSPMAQEAKRRGAAAWSMYKLASVGHAGLVYAADHDDLLPFAPGNYAFSVTYPKDGTCEAIDPQMGAGCKPANVVLQGYGVDYATFRSPADEALGPDEPKTWFELTRTDQAQGSSYEYWWTRGLSGVPTNEQKDAATTPMFVSMFTVPGDKGEEHQVVYANGQIGTATRAKLEQAPAEPDPR